MRRDESVYLADIVDCWKKIERYTAGQGFDDFRGDEKTIDSVNRDLEIIGEASKYVSDDTRKLMPDVEWSRMVGLRDVLIHNYPGVNLGIVWDVIKRSSLSCKKRSNSSSGLVEMSRGYLHATLCNSQAVCESHNYRPASVHGSRARQNF